MRARRLAVTAAAAGALLLPASASLLAQAWATPAGVGSLNLSFQWIEHTGHVLSDGKRIIAGQSATASIYLEGEYAFSDRFSVALGVPYVYARSTNDQPPPPFVTPQPRDQCDCWHSALQDFGLSARYNLLGELGGAFALTPSVSIGVPSHDYEYRGESVVGRNLQELRLGLDVGQRLDFLSPRLSIQGSYSYAFVERVLKLQNDRSDITIGLAGQVSRRLNARVFTAWQRTHGGLRAGGLPPYPLTIPGEINTPERVAQHDRILRDNSFHAGGGLSYGLRGFDLFASYVAFVSGTDTHSGRAFTVGVSWPFVLR